MATSPCSSVLLGITQEAQTQQSLHPCSVVFQDSSTATTALPERDQHYLSLAGSIPAHGYQRC